MLCIGGLTHSGLLHMLKIIRGSSVSAELVLLLCRWWGKQGLAACRRAAPTHFLTAWLWRRCRRSIWVKRLRGSMWLVWRICGRGRGHGWWSRKRSRVSKPTKSAVGLFDMRPGRRRSRKDCRLTGWQDRELTESLDSTLVWVEVSEYLSRANNRTSLSQPMKASS